MGSRRGVRTLAPRPRDRCDGSSFHKPFHLPCRANHQGAASEHRQKDAGSCTVTAASCTAYRGTAHRRRPGPASAPLTGAAPRSIGNHRCARDAAAGTRRTLFGARRAGRGRCAAGAAGDSSGRSRARRFQDGGRERAARQHGRGHARVDRAEHRRCVIRCAGDLDGERCAIRSGAPRLYGNRFELSLPRRVLRVVGVLQHAHIAQEV